MFSNDTSFTHLKITAPIATFLKGFTTFDIETSKQDDNQKI